MNPRPFPTVATYPLPASLSRLPMTEAAAEPAPEPVYEKSGSGSENMVQAVSDAIARRARQRRYTP